MEFKIGSVALERLKPAMKKAIELIEKAINDKRPILIRHHADCDGYCGAIALERAILSRLYTRHRRESDIYFYYKRLPSRAPYYDYSDATRDITSFLNDIFRHSHKAPLIILVDNGSTESDILALKKIKLYKAKLITIDHHPPAEEADSLIDIHINPYLVGADSNICAGMLGAELGSALYFGSESFELLAALAGIADKSASKEIDSYLALAEKKGITKEFLKKLAEVVNFEAKIVGASESRFLMDDLLFGNSERQKRLIEIDSEEINKRISAAKEAIKELYKAKELKSGMVALLNTDLASKQYEYPGTGKLTSLLLETALENSEKKVFAAIGYGKGLLCLRINTDKVSFGEIAKKAKEKLSYGLISGGGHPKAGTLTFCPAITEKMLKLVIECFDSMCS